MGVVEKQPRPWHPICPVTRSPRMVRRVPALCQPGQASGQRPPSDITSPSQRNDQAAVASGIIVTQDHELGLGLPALRPVASHDQQRSLTGVISLAPHRRISRGVGDRLGMYYTSGAEPAGRLDEPEAFVHVERFVLLVFESAQALAMLFLVRGAVSSREYRQKQLDCASNCLTGWASGQSAFGSSS